MAHVEEQESPEATAVAAPEDDAEASADSESAPQTRKPLGQLALEAGLVTNQQLASAFSDIASSGKKLGEVFVDRGWIDESQLERLLAHQARTGPPPADEAAEAEAEAAVVERDASAGLGDIRRDLDELLAEVERRAAAASERAGREAELEARLSEAETMMRVRDGDLAAARDEIERLTKQLEERDDHDAAVRAALERVTQQLSSRD